jgi:hypothetical protein
MRHYQFILERRITMSTTPEEQELRDRLDLIETMISEGRQSTERWGWDFILWGVAYYIAIAWGTWGHSNLAWPVTMVSAGLVTAIVASRMSSHQPETTMGRALGAIWVAVGIALFIFCLCSSLAGRIDVQTFIAAIAAVLGAANAASSIILKWKAQFACALVWWTVAATSPFCTENQSGILFLVAIFLCQIVFGAYMMLCEARERKAGARKSGTAHA